MVYSNLGHYIFSWLLKCIRIFSNDNSMITANRLCKGSNLPKITIIIDVLLASLIQDFSNVRDIITIT